MLKNKNQVTKTFIIIFLLFIFFSLFFDVKDVLAAEHYVRPNGGNYGFESGANWNNAFDGLPNELERGDTYYIASGTYYVDEGDCKTNKNCGAYDFDDNEDGEKYIYIYKATADEHGSATDWEDSYGVGQAYFNADPISDFSSIIDFSSGYWVFDGKTRGADISDSSKYGFKITSLSPVDPDRAALYGMGLPAANDSSKQLDHITIRNTAVIMPGEGYNYNQIGLISKATGELARSTDILIQNCYFEKSTTQIAIVRSTGIVIEGCYFYDNWSTPDHHGCGLVFNNNCINGIVRNNYFKESYSYAIGWHKNNSGDGPVYHKGFQIYNNIIDGKDPDSSFSAIENSDSGTVDVIHSFQVHHNLLVNVAVAHFFLVGNITDVENNKSFAYNNLAYNVSNPKFNNFGYTSGAIVHENNAFYDCTWNKYDGDENGTAVVVTGDPFVDSANGDFRLKKGIRAIDSGKALTPPFNIDRGGIYRPQGAGWDIGAYEYAGNIPTDTISPSHPSGLSVR